MNMNLRFLLGAPLPLAAAAQTPKFISPPSPTTWGCKKRPSTAFMPIRAGGSPASFYPARPKPTWCGNCRPGGW
ncbi:MAG: hypothetical protein WKG07_48020 [Hymenobacter sp.]